MTRGRCVVVVVLGMLMIASAAAAAASGIDITPVEGQSFTGDVVGGLVCPLASATITWGDATATSAGSSDGSTGIYGTHTYAEEGSYSGSVSYTYTPFRTCPTGTQTASFQARVQDAALTASGGNLSGTAGQPLSGVVAHFTDANPPASAGEFSAQIGWGDGARTFGTVAAAPAGGFDISGTHTYSTAGSYAVSVTVSDLGGSASSASSAAQIAAPPPPPPPPAHITARFIVNPSAPCLFTKTLLDARDSTLAPGGTNTIYTWDIQSTNGGGGTPGEYDSADPVFVATSDLPYDDVEQEVYVGHATHNTPGFGPTGYNIFDVHLLASPIQVSLTIQQDVPGQGVIYATSPVRTVTFTNADVKLRIGYPGFSPTGTPPVWVLSPGRRHGCPAVTARRFFGVAGVPSSVALAKLAAHSLVVLTAGRSIKLKAGCKNLVKNCFASLDVLARAPKLTRTRRSLPASLGSKTFVVPAGKTISVTIPLKARGQALARAHNLHQVTLVLGSIGARGKIVQTLRTVRLRTGR